MKKRSLMLVSAIALALVIVAGGTLAWFTADAEVSNSFRAGTLEIDVVEEFDEEGAQNVNPGDQFNKQVQVENLGSKRAYVRVKLTALWQAAEGKEIEDPNALEPAELVGLNTDDWVDGEDGYFYYKHILAAEGGITNPLFTHVKFAGADMGDQYQGASFSLDVEAEAIQVTNGAAEDAAGWGIDLEALGIETL